MRHLLAMLALALGIGPVIPARAQAPQLYELRLPDGYSLLRYANTLPSGVALRSDFDLPRQIGTEGAARITPYYVVQDVAGKQLELRVTVDGAATTLRFAIQPNTFNTLLVTRQGDAVALQPIQDTTEFNQLRARLTFYNGAAPCGTATLALEPSGRAVLADVAPGAMSARTVTPTAARVRTSCGSARVGPLDLGRLEAGQLASVWLMAPGGTPVLFTSRDTIAPPGR
jgi:hypothetical protein